MSFVADLHGFPDAQLRAAPSRERHLLGIALAASLAIHVAGIAIAPGMRRFDEQPPRPLEVMIVRPPVPEPVRPRMVPKPPPPVPKTVPHVRQETPRAPTPVAVPEKKILALPEPALSSPNVFTVPKASVEPVPSAPVAAAPSPATAPTPPVRETPSTPPSFNAAYLRNAPPRYPLIARRNGVEGTVRLKVLVNRDGRPTQVQVEQSSGSSALDNAALEAVKSWQFVPARKGPDAIESWVLVPVVFKLESVS